MTDTRSDAIRLTAEDFEFVPARAYSAFHACGAVIVGLGSQMHRAIAEHTDGCDWKEPTA